MAEKKTTAIVRGTTPTIKFIFDSSLVNSISTAFLTLKQKGQVVIEKDISTATKENLRTLFWTLTQEESLQLSSKTPVEIYCDWKLEDGTRGASVTKSLTVKNSGKEEII